METEVSGPGPVCSLCVWPGYSCISVPAWRLPTTPSLLAGFPGPCAGADASFLHKKEQTWLDLDLCGSRPTGSKGTSCCQWLSARSISCNPICVSVQCHDPGMQLVLRQLPAGHSNCRCVFFYLFIYVNRVQSLKWLSHAMQGMWQSG